MEYVLYVLIAVLVAVVAWLIVRVNKDESKDDEEVVEDLDINLYQVLLDINLQTRMYVENDDVKIKMHDLINSASKLYESVLKMDNESLVLGPKYQLERVIVDHLVPYTHKFIEAQSTNDSIDTTEFVSGLNSIQEEIDKTQTIIDNGKLNDFEKNHKFITIKYS